MELNLLNNYLLGVVMLFFTTFSEVSTFKVLSSTENLSEFDPNTSEAKLKGSYEAELSEMTVCWRFFQYRRLPPSSSFLSAPLHITDPNHGHLFSFLISPSLKDDSLIKYALMDRLYYVSMTLLPQVWNHVCAAVQASTARITLVSNGKVISDKIDEDMEKTNSTLSFSLNVHLMYSTFGRATDLQIWDHWKSPEELLRWVDCQGDGREGNLVAWTSSQWDLVGLVEKQVCKKDFLFSHKNVQGIKESVCMPLDPGLQILTNYRSWEKGVEVCTGLGGKVTVGRTENSRNAMKELVREHTESCGGGFFLGYTDLVTEGEWRDWETGEPLPADLARLWAPSEPNGLEWEGCMETGIHQESPVFDVDCE